MRLRSFVVAAFGVALLAGLTACAPKPPPPPDPWDTAVGECWGPTISVSLDLKYTGPKNTLNNGYYSSTINGTCVYNGMSATIVQADDEAAAMTLCDSLGALAVAGYARVNLGWGGATIPADAWAC